MFDFVKKNKWTARVILVILIIPFLFFGVNWIASSRTSDVAEVDGTGISAQQFDNMLQNAKNTQAMQGNMEAYNTTAEKLSLLQRAINERVLQVKANKEGFHWLNDAQLREIIAGNPEFQVDGNFSAEQYRRVLSEWGISPLQYENQVQVQRMQIPLLQPIMSGEFAVKTTAENYFKQSSEERNVTMAFFSAEHYAKDVKVTDEQIAAYYDDHKSDYMMPERVSLEYLKFTKDDVLKSLKLSEQDLRDEYERNLPRYTTPEERRAAHILIELPNNSSDADRNTARAKAESLLQQVLKAPATFAAVAKKESQDPGSSAQGGDLGIIKTGNKEFESPFELAITDAKQSGIVNHVVETTYGYHVIRVDITPAKQLPFADARSRVESDLRQQRASEIFAERADMMKNQVFEMADTFEEAAKSLGINISRADFLTRAQVAQLANGDKDFSDLVFSDASLNDRLNTEAVDIGSDALISARVIDHKPVSQRPLTEVTPSIRAKLEKESALKLAVQAGEADLAKLKAGEKVNLKFGESEPLRRQMQNAPANVTPDVLRRIFQASTQKLPTYFDGIVGDDKYVIYRLDSVVPGTALSVGEAKQADTIFRNLRGNQLLNAYMQTLREEADVKIYQAKLHGNL
jgi:peptidyl-prolyl cis-trans isomerase D